MDHFIDFLEEIKCTEQDEQTIIKFKEKLNEPIADHIQHLKQYKFNKLWFLKLDDILIDLGYRALDKDIQYIRKELKKLIYNTHVNKIIKKYNEIKKTNIKSLNIQSNCGIYGFMDIIEITEYQIRNIDNVDMWLFSQNEADIAVKFLIEHPVLINWYGFSYNKNNLAIKYMLKKIKRINWNEFSKNEADIAVKYLIKHPNLISWEWFSQNTNDIAVHYCIKNLDKIDWYSFSQNESDIAVHYLIEHPDKISWTQFSSNANDNAVGYSIKYPDNIIWKLFSINISDIAVKYLIEHPDKIDWNTFHINRNNIVDEYLIKNTDKMLCVETEYYISRINKKKHTMEYLLDTQNVKNANVVYYICLKLKQWKIDKFNELNWFPSSKMIL